MALRKEAGDESVVVRKCDTRETRQHVLGRNSFSDERIQSRCEATPEKICTKPIERDKDGGRGESRGAIEQQAASISNATGCRGDFISPEGKEAEKDRGADQDEGEDRFSDLCKI